MSRKKIIAGNWKMNMTPSEAVALVNELKPLVANDEVDVVFCVPAIDIIPAMEAAKGSNINIGAEVIQPDIFAFFCSLSIPDGDAQTVCHQLAFGHKKYPACVEQSIGADNALGYGVFGAVAYGDG